MQTTIKKYEVKTEILDAMMITLFKKDSRDKLHYYTLHDRQLALVSQYALTVAWSSGKGSGREKIQYFSTRREMDAKIRQLFGAKVRDGYTLLYRFERDILSNDRYSDMARLEKAKALLSAANC